MIVETNSKNKQRRLEYLLSLLQLLSNNDNTKETVNRKHTLSVFVSVYRLSMIKGLSNFIFPNLTRTQIAELV